MIEQLPEAARLALSRDEGVCVGLGVYAEGAGLAVIRWAASGCICSTHAMSLLARSGWQRMVTMEVVSSAKPMTPFLKDEILSAFGVATVDQRLVDLGWNCHQRFQFRLLQRHSVKP
jgi:hypothetical protein